MQYFIDFEATQFSGEIISLGCVDENGRQFYSLMKPAKPSAVTAFIVELTGIRPEDLADAPSADTVFNRFLDWMCRDEVAQFFSYGDSDAYFLERTLPHLTDFRAQLGLSVIHSSLCDYAAEVKKRFSLKHSIALKKVAAYYRGGPVEQTHNSLADALLLKEIYDCAQREPLAAESPFPEYQQGADLPKNKKRITATAGSAALTFASFGKAAEWVMSEQMNSNDVVTDKTKSKVCSRIINAAEKNRPYCGYRWHIGGFQERSDAHDTP